MRTLHSSVLFASLLLIGAGGEAQEAQQKHELGAMAPGASVELSEKEVTAKIRMNKDADAQINAALAPSSRRHLLLTVGAIDFDKIPDVHYQVYLDLPPKTKSDYKSVNFVGNLDFFSLHHTNQPEGRPSVNFDITRTIRELKTQKLWDDKNVTVTFVVVWLEDRNGQLLPVPPGVRARFSTLTISSVTLGSAPPGIGVLP